MKRFARAAAAALFGLGALGHAELARACSVCQAGDPRYSSAGSTVQEQGGFSFYLEYQGWRKTSGLLPEEPGEPAPPGREVNESQMLTAYLSYTPLDRLTLTLHVPFRFNENIEEPLEEERSRNTLTGFGDLAVTGSYLLWRSREVLPDSWVEGRVFLKAPTGNDSRKVNGEFDPHLQLGTGSWDYGFGLAAAHRTSWGSLYASVFERINSQGALDYRFGNNTLVNLAVEAPLGHLLGAPTFDFLTPGFELNFRYAPYDEFGGEIYRDSGGSVLYATPSVRIRLPWFEGRQAPSLRFAVQLPVTQSWLHGQQHEGPVWSTGLAFAF